MEVYYTDEVYRKQDGIRDPFQWARFRGPRTLIGVSLLVVVLLAVGGRDPKARVRGDAIDAAGGVIGAAMRITERSAPHLDI
jgi:hypothetical protein